MLLSAVVYYAVKSGKDEPVPDISEETPAFKDIFISNIFCKGAGRAVFFNGLPEMPIKNISIKNMVVTNAKKGIFINRVDQVNMENIEVKTPDDLTIQIENATGITINGKEYDSIFAKRLLTINK